MHPIRKRLTYANVMSSIAVFLVLGGAAIAAIKLPKNSVGTKQLKNSSVTTAKIRKAAVNGNKIADGSITGVDINTSKTTFARVVAKLRGSAPLTLTEEFQAFPLSPSTYMQAAEEDDTFVGAAEVTFQPGCEAPRSANAYLLADPTNAVKLEPPESLVGYGAANDETGGTVSKRIEIGAASSTTPKVGMVTPTRFEPGTAKNHTLTLVIKGECKSGNGITATFGGVDVIGTK